MANKWAIQNGNWSDGSTWNDGVVPTADDDVWLNGFTVSASSGINANLITNKANDLLNISNGGQITAVNGVVISSTIDCGDNVIISIGGTKSILYIVGDIFAGEANNAAVSLTGNQNTLNVLGNLCCDGRNGFIALWYYGTFVLTGNCEGGDSARSIISCGNNYFNGITINGNVTIKNGDFIGNYNNGGNVEINGNVRCEGVGKFMMSYVNNSFILNGSLIAKQDSKVSFMQYAGVFDIRSNSQIGYSGNNFGLGWKNIQLGDDVKYYCVDTVPDLPLEFINREIRVFPDETEVKSGVQYGTLELEYTGNMQVPPESVVLEGYQYGDKVGTLKTVPDNVTIVNLTEQEVERVKNCATVSTVQKCFEEFKE